jgi:hypothetical protein
VCIRLLPSLPQWPCTESREGEGVILVANAKVVFVIFRTGWGGCGHNSVKKSDMGYAGGECAACAMEEKGTGNMGAKDCCCRRWPAARRFMWWPELDDTSSKDREKFSASWR